MLINQFVIVFTTEFTSYIQACLRTVTNIWVAIISVGISQEELGGLETRRQGGRNGQKFLSPAD